MEKETITEEAADYLKIAVKAGYNCFYLWRDIFRQDDNAQCTGTVCASGERVVVIEDSAELQIKQIENIVRLECRNANVQGKGK